MYLLVVALILKVGKYVLQLVENLAFNSCLHRASIDKCVLQIELKRSAICVFSGQSEVPACIVQNYRAAVVPAFLWRNYRRTFGLSEHYSNRMVKTRGPNVHLNLSRPRVQSDRD